MENPDIAKREGGLKKALFYDDLRTMPWWKGAFVHTFRIVYAIFWDIYEDRITLRATSLVYTTLLSIVPTLAIVFSVLKSFEYHNKLKESLISFTSPMGERGVEITDYIMSLVERVDPGVLGSVGLVFLIYAIISMVSKVEASINEIWGVEVHRPLVRRFSDYLSAVILGPVLILIILGIMANFFTGAAAELIPGIAGIKDLVDKALPNALIIMIFLFLYKALPNDRVSLISALIGAVCASLLWQISGTVFAHFVASSSRLAELYSVFVTMIIFFIWLNFAWLIILIGASIAFYHQYPLEAVTRKFMRSPSSVDLRRLSVEIALLLGYAHRKGYTPWTSEGLARRLHVPKRLIDHLLSAMEGAKLIYAIDSRPAGFVLSRPAEHLSVSDIMDSSRVKDAPFLGRENAPGLDVLMTKLDGAKARILQDVHLSALLDEREMLENGEKDSVA
ncbi:MAG: YihY family inner membrane protein [Alphaproteobacteria bacterium]|nr:YihY family inner membrane protein [Alphaproteobacteria bacterium]MCB9974679.1 YihY family inner membrane protein [Rhodospirillales bacterium]